ncbi:MAG: NFACT RNA binding domain-containing protein [Clostridiales Family XIII bacterium]|jgi:predicted ribosome quality control (RQC) complex YloA/Tae2 family protein|nr:NFACT RNA binding domain-containing protein [Clostridiales Family XIII bacterium]
MAFDNYVVGAVSRELNSVLAGGRVDRIYQPEREEVILCVNRPPVDGRPPGRFNLLISASANRPLLYLTELREAGPQNPPAFCMLLRKYLIGARIESVSAAPRERIVRIDFLATLDLGQKEPRTLIFELMGKHSNIIFLDGAHIVDAIKRVTGDMSRVRQTLPGMDYTLPPPGKGISPLMEEETKNADLTGKGLAYFDALAAAGDYAPTIYFDGDRAADFHVFRLSVYEGLRTRDFAGGAAVSEMLETWFESRETQGHLSARTNELKSALKARTDKLYLKKQRLLEDLEEAARADGWRETGDLVTANIWRIEKGAKRVALEDYMHDGAVRTIDLNPRLTPAGNAQRFYKLYSKAKTAAVVKAKQLEETQGAIDYLESVAHFLGDAASPQDIEELRTELTETGYLRPKRQPGLKRKNKPAARGKKAGRFAPFEYTLPSGARLLVGRNNAENDELTLRVAAKTDFWLHTKNIPGSHVILKPFGTEPDGEDLRRAAEAAAWYSKARASEGVPVDYVSVRHVKKPSGARPGYVIFTHNRTLYVTPKLPE